jgi:3,4-dehydroadipyl-CoA semialdehyde dehydrogenase
MRIVRSYLEDRWVSGEGSAATLYDAATGAALATASTAGLDLGAALAHGRKVGGPALRKLTFAQRGELLKALADAIFAARDELCDLAQANSGNTRSDAKFDIDGASGTLAWYGALGQKLGNRTFLLDGGAEPIGRGARFVGQHVMVPRRGVAIHINAFNFPAWGLCEKAACALLAGMPILSKPATATALVTARIVELWTEKALLPPGAVQLLCGGAGDLLDHVGPQDVVAFTGSGDTGAKIRGHSSVIKHNVPVNIEADSLNAAVLGPDVEAGSETFEMFVGDVVRDMTQKAGQKCTAIRRILVPNAAVDATIEALTDRLSAAAMGNPGERATTVGPLATSAQQRDIRRGIESLAKTATAVYAATGTPEQGFWVGPALFRDDRGADAPFVHEHEVFGPVATVLPWSGDAEGAVEIVARGGGQLVTSIYSDDAAWARHVLLNLAAWHGRLVWGSKKIHDQSFGPGTVLPGFIHGGPGKAGGGEELGGERGLRFYSQRTAIQGERGLLERILEIQSAG